MTALLPNPFIPDSANSSLADALTVAAYCPPAPDAATVIFSLPEVRAEAAPGMVRDSNFRCSTISGLGKTQASLVFGFVASELRAAVRDINSHIAFRNLASTATISNSSFSKA